MKNGCDKCCHIDVCKNKVKIKGVQEAVESALRVNSFDGLRVIVICDHCLELVEGNKNGEYWK